MKTQDELYNEYIELIDQMLKDRSLSDNDGFLDKCDEVWYAMDKETHQRVETYLIKKSKTNMIE
jgi:hypothetical protein